MLLPARLPGLGHSHGFHGSSWGSSKKHRFSSINVRRNHVFAGIVFVLGVALFLELPVAAAENDLDFVSMWPHAIRHLNEAIGRPLGPVLSLKQPEATPNPAERSYRTDNSPGQQPLPPIHATSGTAQQQLYQQLTQDQQRLKQPQSLLQSRLMAWQKPSGQQSHLMQPLQFIPQNDTPQRFSGLPQQDTTSLRLRTVPQQDTTSQNFLGDPQAETSRQFLADSKQDASSQSPGVQQQDSLLQPNPQPQQQKRRHSQSWQTYPPQRHSFASVFACEEKARIAAEAEGVMRQIRQIRNSVRDFVAALNKKVAVRAPTEREELEQQERGQVLTPQLAEAWEAWEAHECLQPYAFAASLLHELQEQRLEERLKASREAFAQFLAAQDTESAGKDSERLVQQQEAPEIPFKPVDSARLRITFLGHKPLSSIQNEGAEDLEVQRLGNEQQQQKDGQREQLHLVAILDRQARRHSKDMAKMKRQIQELFSWSDACAMAAVRRLKAELSECAAAATALLSADAAFAASARAALLQVLQLLGDRSTAQEDLENSRHALEALLEPVLVELEGQQLGLQRQRLPLLQRLNQSRRRLALLVEAASGIAKSVDGAAMQGGSFCGELLQQLDRLQAPDSESRLLLAHQLHHERLLEGMRVIAASLRSFLTFHTDAADLSEGDQIVQPPCSSSEQLDRLLASAGTLRSAALELAGAIRLSVGLLKKEEGSSEPPLVMHKEGDTNSESVSAISAEGLLEAMQKLQHEAKQQMEAILETHKHQTEEAMELAPPQHATSTSSATNDADAAPCVGASPNAYAGGIPGSDNAQAAAAAASAATDGLFMSARTCASELRDRLENAIDIYNSARHLLAVASAASAQLVEVDVYIFKQRERQERKMVAEGTREQLRQDIKRQAAGLMRLAAFGLTGTR
ncbi:hypothetical protein cyc_04662 [Cyclospora cayetanensis]|uniref:Transmembrane protein n=1 Tax=Cyclospora cayetanensis TaxID=88456 RepID=A0A1D3CZF3_9EIME|nr:hypothetical protein cyc_04662 [Cyclospora cayetanensis]